MAGIVSGLLDVDGRSLAMRLNSTSNSLHQKDLDSVKIVLSLIQNVTRCFSLKVEGAENETMLVERGTELQKTSNFLAG